MLQKSTLDFLKKLKKNNNREWFAKNKSLYEDAKNDFDVFIFELINDIAEFDESVSGLEPKNCTFRIYKDIRFSKDKTPYKTGMGASINKGGRKSDYPGYYFHLQPGECFLAGGKYMPMPDQLLAIRKKIFNNTKKFEKVVKNKEFVKLFGTVRGEKLKTSPKGFPKDHPSAEYLKYKSFIVMHKIDDAKALSKNIIDYAVKVFKNIKPLNDFMGSI
jgi:uncharacterized protein (TIGR02453 family)